MYIIVHSMKDPQVTGILKIAVKSVIFRLNCSGECLCLNGTSGVAIVSRSDLLLMSISSLLASSSDHIMTRTIAPYLHFHESQAWSGMKTILGAISTLDI